MSAARTNSTPFRRKVPFPATSPTSPSSPSLKNRVVFLHGWWLIKTDPDSQGRRLGVGGLSSNGKQVERHFRSAPIGKRDDNVTFRTVDGVTVLVHGCINKTETLRNGFPRKVCHHFQIGFPFDWEEYSCMSFDEHEKLGPGNCERGMLQQLFNNLMQKIDFAQRESDSSNIPASSTPFENSRKYNIETSCNDMLQPSDDVKNASYLEKQTEAAIKASVSKYLEATYGEMPAGNLLNDQLNQMKDSSELPFIKNNYQNSETDAPGGPGCWETKEPEPVPAGTKQASPCQRKRGCPKKGSNVPPAAKKAKAKPTACKTDMKTSDDIIQQGDAAKEESCAQVKPVSSAPNETPVKHMEVEACKEVNSVQPIARLTRSRAGLL